MSTSSESLTSPRRRSFFPPPDPPLPPHLISSLLSSIICSPFEQTPSAPSPSPSSDRRGETALTVGHWQSPASFESPFCLTFHLYPSLTITTTSSFADSTLELQALHSPPSSSSSFSASSVLSPPSSAAATGGRERAGENESEGVRVSE